MIYDVSNEELDSLENSLDEQMDQNSLLRKTKKYVSTTNGKFKKSSAAGIAAAIASVAGFGGVSAFLSIAAILLGDSTGNTIYFKYTQTSWRAKDGFHVKGNFKFYKDKQHKKYIRQFTINRVYQND